MPARGVVVTPLTSGMVTVCVSRIHGVADTEVNDAVRGEAQREGVLLAVDRDALSFQLQVVEAVWSHRLIVDERIAALFDTLARADLDMDIHGAEGRESVYVDGVAVAAIQALGGADGEVQIGSAVEA